MMIIYKVKNVRNKLDNCDMLIIINKFQLMNYCYDLKDESHQLLQ